MAETLPLADIALHEQIVIFRGTPVTCARNILDWEMALRDDLRLSHIPVGGGAFACAGFLGPILRSKRRIEKILDPKKGVTASGHSLGGVEALLYGAVVPRTVPFTVAGIAPPQGANVPYWKAAYEGRPVPAIIGRRKDFAPGWNHFDMITCGAGRITHLLGDGAYEMLPTWPHFDDSIPDHSVADYVTDLEAFPDIPNLIWLAKLAAAVYEPEDAAMIKQCGLLGASIREVVEEAGFRAVILVRDT